MVRFHSKSSQKLSATWFSSSAVSWTCYKTNPSDRRVHTISYSFCQHWAFLWACMRKHSVRQNCDHFLDFRWLHRHSYRWRRSTMKEMPVYSMGWSPLRFHHTSQPWLHLGQSATSSMPLSQCLTIGHPWTCIARPFSILHYANLVLPLNSLMVSSMFFTVLSYNLIALLWELYTCLAVYHTLVLINTSILIARSCLAF